MKPWKKVAGIDEIIEMGIGGRKGFFSINSHKRGGHDFKNKTVK